MYMKRGRRCCDDKMGLLQFLNISSLSCRIVFVLFVIFSVAPAAYSASVNVEVKVTGVDSLLKENVLARLTLYLQKDNVRLKESTVKRLHEKAKDDIASALAPFGYYNTEVKTTLTEDEKGFHATYEIEKGPPVIVESVQNTIIGDGRDNGALKKALNGWGLHVGKILDQSLYEKEKKKLVNAAINQGYLDVIFVKKELIVNPVTNKANVTLILDTKKQYVFGETSCKQEVLAQQLLDRYLPYSKGDAYQPAKIYELQAILYRTDYFRRVIVKGKMDQVVDHTVPVEIELISPEKLNKYNVGAGYATDTGIRGKLDWFNRIFNNRGHKISASLLVAELENSLTLQYEIPRKDPRYDTLIHSLGYQDTTWDDTDTRLITGAISQEHSGPRFKLSMGLEIRDEVYDIGDTSGDSTLLLPSLNAGYIFADDILNTTHGLSASVNLSGAYKGFISDASFLQTTVNGKAIFTPFRQWKLIGRVSIGATLVDSIDSLPPSLRYYTGGDSTIRGYSYKSIGTEDSSGTVIGGRYLVVQSVEMERIINQYWSVAGFWDGGTATDDLSLDYYQGVGGGIRFRLPFGQIRLDVASAITEDGTPFRVHLTVGGDL
ncbi:MAG: translocation and assembly module TamA [Desulforhopalus sp.]|jgi:translocation and assembly module TamA